MGEGGGQVLRTSLALSMVTGRSFRIGNIRAGRKQPGLMRQHLAAVQAAAGVCNAEVSGAELRSGQVTFMPGPVTGGHFHFAVGSAGSASLVLQTVLPPLCLAQESSTMVLEGGTHNAWAPPYDFLEKAFLPCLQVMGPRVASRLDRPGFYPAGGGKLRVTVNPVEAFTPWEMMDRGKFLSGRAVALVSQLPDMVGERELKKVRELLQWAKKSLELVQAPNPKGPGNALSLFLEYEKITEVVTAFGKKGLPAEQVAAQAVEEARRYLDSGVPVGEHLADQLLIYLALAGKGRFLTLPPSQHTRTNMDVIRLFLDASFSCREIRENAWEIVVE